MKVYIHDIHQDGLVINKVLEAYDIELSESDFKCLSPLKVDIFLEKADDEVIADVKVQGKYEFSCARCLDPVVVQRTDSFNLYFDIDPKVEMIDLGEDIRQELVVALSAIALCKEACKGICQDCGINLNDQLCQCSKQTQDTRHMIQESKLKI